MQDFHFLPRWTSQRFHIGFSCGSIFVKRANMWIQSVKVKGESKNAWFPKCSLGSFWIFGSLDRWIIRVRGSALRLCSVTLTLRLYYRKIACSERVALHWAFTLSSVEVCRNELDNRTTPQLIGHREAATKWIGQSENRKIQPSKGAAVSKNLKIQ